MTPVPRTRSILAAGSEAIGANLGVGKKTRSLPLSNLCASPSKRQRGRRLLVARLLGSAREGAGHRPGRGEAGAVERMPKKKRKIADGSDAQPQDKEGEESKVSSNATLKHSFVDACIVISDSDGEQESKDEPVPQKKRTKQQLDRAKFAAKRKIARRSHRCWGKGELENEQSTFGCVFPTSMYALHLWQ
ncbi:BRCA1-A complex subunit RAP80 [Varanus komodoensis]|nr:BRCA1-A complex subunit RAP80 [Varanus komodoensis]